MDLGASPVQNEKQAEAFLDGKQNLSKGTQKDNKKGFIQFSSKLDNLSKEMKLFLYNTFVNEVSKRGIAAISLEDMITIAPNVKKVNDFLLRDGHEFQTWFSHAILQFKLDQLSKGKEVSFSIREASENFDLIQKLQIKSFKTDSKLSEESTSEQ